MESGGFMMLGRPVTLVLGLVVMAFQGWGDGISAEQLSELPVSLPGAVGNVSQITPRNPGGGGHQFGYISCPARARQCTCSPMKR